jgi:S-DNA-T family DNA segregation ATPase FtsK/SpoIIIE
MSKQGLKTSESAAQRLNEIITRRMHSQKAEGRREESAAQRLNDIIALLGKTRKHYQTTVFPLADDIRRIEIESEVKQKEKADQQGNNLGCAFFFALILGGTIGAMIFGTSGGDGAVVGMVLGAVIAIIILFGVRSSNREGVRAKYEVELQQRRSQYKGVKAQEHDALRAAVEKFSQEMSAQTRVDHPSSLPWSHAAWKQWQPAVSASEVIRLGELAVPELDKTMTPCLLPFPYDRGVLFLSDSGTGKDLVAAVHSVLLRMLVAQLPGKLRFTLIDPIGMGQNVAALLPLGDHNPELIHNRAWSESRHIEERLAELSEQMETVIQRYLRTEYATLADYNAKAGEVAEPYRVLVLFDYPTNITEESTRRLLSLIKNGARCGIYTMLTTSRQHLTKGEGVFGPFIDLEEIKPYMVVIDAGAQYRLTYGELLECPITLDDRPAPALLEMMIKQIGPASVEASKVQVPFEKVIPANEQWWKGKTEDYLSVPVGPAGARKLQDLTLGRGTAIHALVAGRTGSGKSTLLHVLIMNLALTYAPVELQLYLIDFKKGVEFKAYATSGLPHARVIAIESEREFGLSVLQGLDVELTKRGETFRAATVDNLGDFRRKTKQIMPRILLIVDEFQEFFTEDDAIAQAASRILDRLVRQGRSFGIHVLMGSQSLAGSYTLARSTIDQMGVRIALQCSEADSRLILAEDNGAARLLSRPGEAVYNDANGLIEGNKPFQVAYLDDDTRQKYLLALALKARSPLTDWSPVSQIVFEGNAPALVAKNQLLTNLFASITRPTPSRRVAAWLGEPIAIKEHTAAYFRRQSGSNLLIVGQNDDLSLGMTITALISLAAQHSAGTACFYILDFSAVDDPNLERLRSIAEMLSHTVQWGRRRELPSMISKVAAEVAKRLEMADEDLRSLPSIYLVVYGLQRARDLRPDETAGFSNYNYSDDSAQPLSPAQQFSTVIQQGPDLGIYTLVWCDTAANLNRMLDRRYQREFETRVVLQMSADDSSNLIDSTAAAKLGPYRALLVNGEEGRQEKFRPYDVPDNNWLLEVGKQLSRWNEQEAK